MTRSRWTLTIGAAILSALVVASWLFVLSPRLAQAGEIGAMVDDVRLQETTLQGKIARLRALEADLPRKIAELEALKQHFPTNADLPELLDQIRAAGTEANVTVEAIQPGVPELSVAGVADPAAQAATPEEQVAQAQAAGGVGLDGATEGLATMRLSVTVSGDYESLRSFLAAVEAMPRSWLVDTVNVVAANAEEGLSMTVEGFMFVLDDANLKVPATTPAS